MRQEAYEQYLTAYKAGKKYYKDALGKGRYPYPVVLDEIIDKVNIAAQIEIGFVNIPSNLIVGSKNAGRVTAMAGNMMPLLEADTEFAYKWINLCEAHLSDEGIRDSIKCYEYMGSFYILEGNKRASVLLSYGAPRIPGTVTRIVPAYSDEKEVKLYYEFMEFFAKSRLYDIMFSHFGCYEKLQAALGFDEDHVWTEDERRSFQAGYAKFKNIYNKACARDTKNLSLELCPEALLLWVQVFSFHDIKILPEEELIKKLTALLPDVRAAYETDMMEVNTEPEIKQPNLFTRIIGRSILGPVKIAFIYGFDINHSSWTKGHDAGRIYLEERMKEKVETSVYTANRQDFYEKMKEAAEDGAKIIFATTPQMIEACRKIAMEYPEIHILNCALAQPYTGVRMYYSRIYEAKFVAGAVAGAMAANDRIGYIADYPIFGVPACINAFALGARLANPRATVKVLWSCKDSNIQEQFLNEGIHLISNRDGNTAENAHLGLEWGTYMYEDEGSLISLATPCWDWGRFYELVVLSVISGAWKDLPDGKSVNYWWGLNQGVIDVKFSEHLPDGVCTLAWILRNGIINGTIDPFHTVITDQNGVRRNDGSRDFTPDELIEMDWLCDNVVGTIPAFDELLPFARNTARLLGIYRDDLVSRKGEKQL